MCGINGIAYSPRSGKQIDEKRLIAMRDVLHHRGPDGDGLFIDGNILSHTKQSATINFFRFDNFHGLVCSAIANSPAGNVFITSFGSSHPRRAVATP